MTTYSPLYALALTNPQAAQAMGILGGLQQGGAQGDTRALASASQLGGNLTGNAGMTGFGNDLGAGLGIYQGLENGGVTGDAQAAASGLRLAGLLGGQSGLMSSGLASGLGMAGGAIAAPLSLYNTIKNWQPGNVGSDALNAASTGAAIGSIVPGIGTLIGGLAGGAIGAIGGAMGNPGDQEAKPWQSYASAYNQDPSIAQNLSPSQAYQNLASVMSAENNSPGHSEPIEQKFGRMGEQNLMDQLTNQINQDYAAGKITPGESIQNQWTQQIYPWLQHQGATINPNQMTAQGTPEGSALIGDLQSLMGSYESGALTPQSQVGSRGQTIGGMQPYMAARGGPMRKTRSRLHELYAGGPFAKRQHFDDGGMYIDVNGSVPQDNSPPPMQITPQMQNVPFDPSSMATQDNQDTINAQVSQLPSSGFMSPLLSAMGLHGLANSSSAGQAGVLAALASLLGKSNVPSQNWNPQTPAMFSGTQPQPGHNMWGNFSSQPRQLNPAASGFNYANYGYGPEQQFFLPPASAPAPQVAPQPQVGLPHYATPTIHGPIGRAEGGTAGHSPQQGYYAGSQHGAYVQGPGDGTSDDINAKLSDGEFVVDAGTVSMLGNGSNKAGAAKLEQLRENLRRHAAQKMSKGKQFMKAKDPEVYAGVETGKRR